MSKSFETIDKPINQLPRLPLPKENALFSPAAENASVRQHGGGWEAGQEEETATCIAIRNVLDRK